MAQQHSGAGPAPVAAAAAAQAWAPFGTTPMSLSPVVQATPRRQVAATHAAAAGPTPPPAPSPAVGSPAPAGHGSHGLALLGAADDQRGAAGGPRKLAVSPLFKRKSAAMLEL